MDLNQIYKKLEKIDAQVDRYMLQTENRLTKLETEQQQTKSFIKVATSTISAVVMSLVAYVLRDITYKT